IGGESVDRAADAEADRRDPGPFRASVKLHRDGDGDYVCDGCNPPRPFATKAALRQHIMKAHAPGGPA
ncbi:MAG TPA: hypothetical protein VIB49_04135, partial [Thermoplasmata archaeon]